MPGNGDQSRPRPPGAGECDRLIKIVTAVETQNSEGEMVPGVPSTLATVWANKVPLGGREGEAARQIQATAAYRWELRHYVAGVTVKMWVDEQGVLFDINEVKEIGRRASLHLGTTQRGVA
jgi:SPP1 family predicted phage head-tail adaptor